MKIILKGKSGVVEVPFLKEKGYKTTIGSPVTGFNPDDFSEFGAESLIGFSEFVDGGDVIGRELRGEGGFHGVQIGAKLGCMLVLSRREVRENVVE